MSNARPRSSPRNRSSRTPTGASESGDYPWDVLEAGMDAALVAQDTGEKYGGRALDLNEYLAIAQEVYRADAGIALALQLASFGASIFEEHGTEEQKETYLRPVAENDRITGLAVSGPETSSDLAGMATTAEKEGDEWVIDGRSTGSATASRPTG
jgi:alkylation response protein AidB-like acyl-CoA dehydrogenase